MRQENPIERYGMARYDAANRRPRGQEGAFTSRDGNQARDEARASARETVAPTFAQLQSQGSARPAPMMANMASAFMPASNHEIVPEDDGSVVPSGGSGSWTPTPGPRPPGSTTRQPTANPVPETLGATGDGSTDDPRWSAILANLEAQFGGQRSRLNEDLARRGLWASTGELGAGARLGDLEGQQSRAIASARADYQFQQDDRYDRLMQMLLPLILGG